jgi:hypothetical protein
MNHTGAASRMVCGLWLIACGLLSCSRPEPSKSSVARPLPLLNPNQTRQASARPAATPGLATSHESEPQVPTSQVVDPNASPELERASANELSTITGALARARKGGKSEVDYLVPDPSELTKYQDYLANLLLQPGASAPAAALPSGFLLEPLAASCLGLLEDPRHKHGAAAVIVRTGKASALAVEVPHSFFDESTLAIGLAVFDAAHAGALIVNTVHRYRSLGRDASDAPKANDEDTQAPASDVAHANISYFLAAHAAFLRAVPGGTAIQIHGFRDSNAEGVDAILSAARTPATLKPMAERLRDALGLRIAVFPKDIQRLGGTTNAQARLSREKQHRFMHLELSQTLRQRLVQDEALLARFAAIVATEAH